MTSALIWSMLIDAIPYRSQSLSLSVSLSLSLFFHLPKGNKRGEEGAGVGEREAGNTPAAPEGVVSFWEPSKHPDDGKEGKRTRGALEKVDWVAVCVCVCGGV